MGTVAQPTPVLEDLAQGRGGSQGKRQDPGRPGFLAVPWVQRTAESHWLSDVTN